VKADRTISKTGGIMGTEIDGMWPERVPGKDEFVRVREEAERSCMALGDDVCVDVGWLVADDGSARWRVAIENADPCDSALARLIEAELLSVGIKAVVVWD
jgi:hypothetical protein